MPPKKRKFESTFPAARIKKIMQLDNDVGRVASSVPVVISRAVEIFLHTLLTRAAGYASSRNAKTLTVGHLKHSIEQEKQWDFLKELTAKISDVTADQEEEETSAPKRGRKRQSSPSQVKPPGRKRRQIKAKPTEAAVEAGKEDEESESEEESPPRADSGGVQHTRIPVTSISSSLMTAPQSGLPHLVAGSVKGPSDVAPTPSIATLTSGLQHSTSHQDSDDDYDE